ncbi:MAG: hypothetical protein R2880_10775 [Deinococcales bacterium]
MKYLPIKQLLLAFSFLVLLSACAPRTAMVGENGTMSATAKASDGRQYQRLSYGADYDMVYYQALRVARSMTLQFLPSASFPSNWYLESEDRQKGHIVLSKSFSICQHKNPESCVTLRKEVVIAVIEANGQTHVDLSASREQDADETEFSLRYIEELNKALN